MMNKYYAIYRPAGIGSVPRDGIVEIHNFDDRQFVNEIMREAWGWVTYDRALTEKEIADYELVSAEVKTWYSVTTAFYDDGKVVSKITDTVSQAYKPQPSEKELKRKTIYVDWFDSKEAADDWVNEALSA